jgi:hypothetical protein
MLKILDGELVVRKLKTTPDEAGEHSVHHIIEGPLEVTVAGEERLPVEASLVGTLGDDITNTRIAAQATAAALGGPLPVSLPATPTANLATIATAPGKLDTIITALGSFLATIATDIGFLKTYNPALPTGSNVIGGVHVLSAASSDTVATGPLAGPSATVVVACAGKATVAMTLTRATLIAGGVIAEASYDGGVTWWDTHFYDPRTGEYYDYTLAVTAGESPEVYWLAIFVPSGASHVRVNTTGSYVSGAGSVVLNAVHAPGVATVRLAELPGNTEDSIGATKIATEGANTKLDTIITALGSFLATIATDIGFLKTYNPALPTGSNVIGKLAANAGVVIGEVALATTPTANLATIATAPGKLDTIITALGLLATNQGVPPAGAILGSVGGINTTTDTAFASKTTVRGITITNLDLVNNLLIKKGATPGPADVDTTTVRPGANSPFLVCTDPSVFKMRSSAGSTTTACYAGA